MEDSLRACLYDPIVGRVAFASATFQIVETPVLDVGLKDEAERKVVR